jgi:hypothetical protein
VRGPFRSGCLDSRRPRQPSRQGSHGNHVTSSRECGDLARSPIR